MVRRRPARAAAAIAAVALLPAIAAAAAPGPPKLSPFDRHFLVAAWQSNHFEIVSAVQARQRARVGAVCTLAGRLIADHTRAGLELTTLAVSVGVRLPPKPAPLQQWALASIRVLPGASPPGTSGTTPPSQTFEHGFAQLQVALHLQAIGDFSEAARVAENPKIRALARRMLPMLHAHLRLAQAAAATKPPLALVRSCRGR
jgi:putative membrane protein